jgi:hypothetical protein
MGIIKRAGILSYFRYSYATVFGRDVSEWVSLKSAKLAQEIYESRLSESSKLSDEEYRKLISLVTHLSEETVAKVRRKLRRIQRNLEETGIIIASGDFGTGERECTTFWALDFLENLGKLLADKTLKALNKYIEWGEKPLVSRSQATTNFEFTLDHPIPAIYEEDLLSWRDYYPDYIAIKVREMGLSKEDYKWAAKEIISEYVNDIFMEIEGLGSRYVNIVEGSFRIGETVKCQIIPVADFISEIYKIAYNSTSKILE